MRRRGGAWRERLRCPEGAQLGGCAVFDGEAPRVRPDGGPPIIRHMFFPAADYTLLDTWSTGGLRGTGSHDFTVEDAFVPERRTFSFAGPPAQPGNYALAGRALLGLDPAPGTSL